MKMNSVRLPLTEDLSALEMPKGILPYLVDGHYAPDATPAPQIVLLFAVCSGAFKQVFCGSNMPWL